MSEHEDLNTGKVIRYVSLRRAFGSLGFAAILYLVVCFAVGARRCAPTFDFNGGMTCIIIWGIFLFPLSIGASLLIGTATYITATYAVVKRYSYRRFLLYSLAIIIVASVVTFVVVPAGNDQSYKNCNVDV